MENRRSIKYLISTITLIILGLVLLFGFLKVEAYTVSTHAELSRVIVAEYEKQRGETFSFSETSAIARGSKEEDDKGRFFNHFYDPVRGVGILNNDASTQWVNNVVGQASWGLGKLKVNDVLFSGAGDYTWERAVYEYAHGDKQRAAEALGHVLHLIQDATVPAHVRGDLHPSQWGIGDKDHHEDFTRSLGANSMEVSGIRAKYFSNIEQAITETAQFTQENFLSKDTIFKKYAMPKREGLKLDLIKIGGDDQYFGVGNYGKIVRIRLIKDWGANSSKEEYFLTDEKNQILTENWNALSKHAVSSGMGVLDLFFREVEYEKQERVLLSMKRSRSDTKRFVRSLAFIRDSKKGAVTSLAAADVYELNKEKMDGYYLAAEAYGIPVPVIARDSALYNQEKRLQPASVILAVASAVEEAVYEPVETPPVLKPKKVVVPEPTPVSVPKIVFETSSELIVLPDPIFTPGTGAYGGGGAPPDTTAPDAPVISIPSDFSVTLNDADVDFSGTAEADATVTITQANSTATSTTVDGTGAWSISDFTFPEATTNISVTATDSAGNVSDEVTESVMVVLLPDMPVLTSPTSLSVATTSVSFIGTGDAGNILTATIGASIATTTIDGTGAWSVPSGTLVEGDTAISFKQTDSDGDDSTEFATTITVDLTAPAGTTLTVLECTNTLRNDGDCLGGSTTINLSWDAVADVDHYGISVEGVEVSTTNATSTTAVLVDLQSSDVIVTTYDAVGNSTASNTVSVEVFDSPVIITEVAWGGTISDDEHEWIELYNRTSYELDLSNVRIRSEDDDINFSLTGTIGTSPWWLSKTYLIERATESVTTRASDLIETWDLLSDSGEELLLEFSSGSISYALDQTPAVSGCSGWCAGEGTGNHESMERIDVNVPGTTTSNWQKNDGYPISSQYKDSGGNNIFGTVKKESSQGYPEVGFYCDPYTSPFDEGGTYSPTIPANIATRNCTYLSGIWDSGLSRRGAAYVGVVGSSTQALIHVQSAEIATENGDIDSRFPDGSNVVMAFWRAYSGSSHSGDDAHFKAYFEGTATTTPHDDFRFFNWIYSD